MGDAIAMVVTTDLHNGDTRTPASLNDYVYANGNPAGYRDPRGLYVEPYSSTFGYDVEREVQRQYIRAFPRDFVLLGKPVEDGLSAAYWKPDILNFSKGLLNEIKPRSPSGVYKGIGQMATYIVSFGLRGFSPDITWVPKGSVVGTQSVYFLNAAGIIFYSDDGELASIAKRVQLSNLAPFLRANLRRMSVLIPENAVYAGAGIAALIASRGLAQSIASTLAMSRF